ncbi:hypothetical protein HPB47_027500 [Ixodes persulcatus]|uniref:Uncharacterized protein n=1 Tax=Ixodes persulcatus TaxID=34615 RepID=A0AC60PVQ5_IXOPE|nr:hypothetical protein HPB47_027500 [Ixodes persulcatus]
MDSLTAEVGELRADNASLRQQAERTTELLRKLQVNSAADLASPQLHLSRSDGKSRMPTAPATAHKEVTTDRRGGAAPPPPSKEATTDQRGGDDRSGSSRSAVGDTEDGDGFQFQRRRRPRPNVGTSSQSTLASVVRTPRQCALFATRLAADTTPSDLRSSLHDLLNGVDVTCTQLTSRHPSYASFHIAIEEQHFGRINTPEWDHWERKRRTQIPRGGRPRQIWVRSHPLAPLLGRQWPQVDLQRSTAWGAPQASSEEQRFGIGHPGPEGPKQQVGQGRSSPALRWMLTQQHPPCGLEAVPWAPLPRWTLMGEHPPCGLKAVQLALLPRKGDLTGDASRPKTSAFPSTPLTVPGPCARPGHKSP